MSEGPHWQVYSNHSLWRRYAPSWSRFQEKQQRHLQVFLCLKKKMCLFLCILFIAMFPGVSSFFCVNQYTENFRIICCLIMLLFKDIWKHINCAAKGKKKLLPTIIMKYLFHIILFPSPVTWWDPRWSIFFLLDWWKFNFYH